MKHKRRALRSMRKVRTAKSSLPLNLATNSFTCIPRSTITARVSHVLDRGRPGDEPVSYPSSVAARLGQGMKRGCYGTLKIRIKKE